MIDRRVAAVLILTLVAAVVGLLLLADWQCVRTGGIWPECYEVRAGHYTRLQGRL
ncbi:MAG TPA: hypothetical protein VK741_25665 [Acetobacteraceae bacterium]|nr:hypothetical protein [Acetobacteraceae bacterium]